MRWQCNRQILQINNYGQCNILDVVNIGLIQLQQYDKLDASSRNNSILKHFKRLSRKASQIPGTKIDFVCLPELWYTRIVKDFEKEFKFILDAAREYDFIIIPGAFKEKVSDDTYVSCPLISPDGRVLGRQYKIHLFGIQRRTMKPGSKMKVFTVGNIKFSVAICYDLVFPEIARSAVREGADLLFFPSKIPKNGIAPWHLYLQVRALENRIPIVASNVCGGPFGGRSAVVDFDYDNRTDIASPKLRIGAPFREEILIVDIDLKKPRQIRQKRFTEAFFRAGGIV